MAKLYQITFSPTGTSRMVAEWISEMFKVTVIPIDLCDKSYKNQS
ncbi:MAG: hypothetical protein Q4A29_02105 [Eubacteriales bacterium]|nr:hypothetical protein [Eubacteriales bacterium]